MASLRCPICGKSFEPSETPAMPFCSPRCRQIDLGRWLDEKNSLPDLVDEETRRADGPATTSGPSRSAECTEPNDDLPG
jgi:uncharacterized protein